MSRELADFVCNYSPAFAIATIATALGLAAAGVRAIFADRSRFAAPAAHPPAPLHPEQRKLLARV